jgi:hypothetical protein
MRTEHDMVVYAYNPNYLRGWGRSIIWAQELKAKLRTYSSPQKRKKNYEHFYIVWHP